MVLVLGRLTVLLSKVNSPGEESADGNGVSYHEMRNLDSLLCLLKSLFVSVQLTKNGAKLQSYSSFQFEFVQPHGYALVFQTRVIRPKVVKCCLQA